MASVLPKPIVARIEWAEGHVTPFSTNAVAIGITTTIASDFETKTEAARAALQDRNAAKDVLRNKEITLRLAMSELTDLSSAIINTVHSKADMVGDSVYALASIPVPATPGPRPMPGEPTDFKVTLQSNGSIILTWACDNFGSGGTQYQVWRRLDGVGGFTGMGATGERKFVDSTIPAGTKTATYQIQGSRTTGAGPFAEFNVNFGVDSSGGTTAMVTKTSGKAAA